MDLSTSSHQKKQNKIGFPFLARAFPLAVLSHFVSSFFFSRIHEFISQSLEILNKENLGGDSANFVSSLYKELSERWPTFAKISAFFRTSTQNNLVFFSLIFVASFASLILFIENFIERQIEVKSSLLLRKIILDKFRRLPFEQKIERKDQTRRLIDYDSEIVASHWDHIYNHSFHSLVSIISALSFSSLSKKTSSLNFNFVVYLVFWILFTNLFYLFFSSYLTKLEEKNKEHISKEISLTEKEISKSILIDGMGLTSVYSSKQEELSKESYHLRRKIDLNFSIAQSTNYFFFKSFAFFAIIISGPSVISSISTSFFSLLRILENVENIVSSLRNYSFYKPSLDQINKFIALEEEEYNNNGTLLSETTKIKEVVFENVSFKYSNEKKNLIEMFTRHFSFSQINSLFGANGSGKSTLIYLLLGMLKPLSGRVLIVLENGVVYDLNKEVNLHDWREKVVCYISHDNLLEEGSTGQRQLANIDQAIEHKKQSQIFIFDEAGNALDKEKRSYFGELTEKLSNGKKIVVTVNHHQNLDSSDL